jgi:hypothetical protein
MPLTWLKCLHVGPWKILWWLGTLYFWKNAYMWDPTEFYDDLEDSVFKIMLTCETDVGLWCFFRAYGITKKHGIGNAWLQYQLLWQIIFVTEFSRKLLTDKRRIPLRYASVWTYTFFTTGFPRFLSIRGARGLQAFDLLLLTNYSNPNYD